MCLLRATSSPSWHGQLLACPLLTLRAGWLLWRSVPSLLQRCPTAGTSLPRSGAASSLETRGPPRGPLKFIWSCPRSTTSKRRACSASCCTRSLPRTASSTSTTARRAQTRTLPQGALRYSAQPRLAAEAVAAHTTPCSPCSRLLSNSSASRRIHPAVPRAMSGRWQLRIVWPGRR